MVLIQHDFLDINCHNSTWHDFLEWVIPIELFVLLFIGFVSISL